jgi:hypothetical protein
MACSWMKVYPLEDLSPHIVITLEQALINRISRCKFSLKNGMPTLEECPRIMISDKHRLTREKMNGCKYTLKVRGSLTTQVVLSSW